MKNPLAHYCMVSGHLPQKCGMATFASTISFEAEQSPSQSILGGERKTYVAGSIKRLFQQYIFLCAKETAELVDID